MQLAWLPVLALIPVMLAIYFADKYIAKRQHRQKSVRPIAESASLLALPSYKKALRIDRIIAIAEKTLLVIMLLILLVIAARPQKSITKINDQESRDIVLCLDVSGSMRELIAPSLETLREVVEKNPTDKYSLVFFQNVGYPAFPLTRDSVAIKNKIDNLLDRLKEDKYAVSAYGYQPGNSGGTDIAEGIYGCIRRFSDLDTERSRHIVMLTDLYNNGETDLDQAAQAIGQYNINLQVIVANRFSYDINDHPWLSRAGATVTEIDEPSGMTAVLNNIYGTILNKDAEKSQVNADNPLPYWLAFSAAAFMFIALLTYREDGKW